MEKQLIGLLIFSYFSFFSANTLAQNSKRELNAFEKKQVNALLTLEECIGSGDYLVVQGKASFNEKGELKAQEFTNQSSSFEFGPFELGIKYTLNFTWDNGKLASITFANNICRENDEEVKITEGKIYSVRLGTKYYYFEFDKQEGLVQVQNSEGYDKNSDNNWQKKGYYQLEYFPSGKLKKIQSMVSIGKGKHRSDVVEVFAYSVEDRIYFENEPNKVRIVRYKAKNKIGAKDIITSDKTIESKQEFSKETFTMIDNLTQKRENKRVVEYNNKDQVIKISSYQSDESVYNVVEGEYDERGWLIKMTDKSYSPQGKTLNHDERFTTYKLKENGNASDKCSYDRKELTRVYNDKGELEAEIQNGQSRQKDSNGVWGPWKQQTY